MKGPSVCRGLGARSLISLNASIICSHSLWDSFSFWAPSQTQGKLVQVFDLLAGAAAVESRRLGGWAWLLARAARETVPGCALAAAGWLAARGLQMLGLTLHRVLSRTCVCFHVSPFCVGISRVTLSSLGTPEFQIRPRSGALGLRMSAREFGGGLGLGRTRSGLSGGGGGYPGGASLVPGRVSPAVTSPPQVRLISRRREGEGGQ